MPDCLGVALEGATRGDEAAISTLYRSLNPPLLRYLRHHVGRNAEDVAADVWLALAPQLASFDGGVGDLRALMFTIARRRTVDHYRQAGRRRSSVPFDEDFDRPAPNDTEALAVSRLTAQSAVAALVRNLPEDQAEIVLLRVLGDLDVEQVAGIVGKTPGAVRVAQHRALAAVAAHLAAKSCNAMSASDDFPRDMHRYPFDDSDADAVFGSSSGADAVPEELRDLAELVDAARRAGSADELVGEDVIVAPDSRRGRGTRFVSRHRHRVASG